VLALATLRDDLPTARSLLAARADPLLEEDNGRSILELARSQAVPQIVELMERAVECQQPPAAAAKAQQQQRPSQRPSQRPRRSSSGRPPRRGGE